MMFDMSGYYIRDASVSVRPAANLLEWARSKDISNRRITATWVGPIWVSTVFLGIDHQYGSGAPILYETMAFWADPDTETGFRKEVDELPQQRYQTEAEARHGHEAIVAQAAALLGLAG